MKHPKLGIQKKRYLNGRGNYRYYSPNYNPANGKIKKDKRPKMPIIDLSYHPEIKTEKQLLKLIYGNWGEGEYLILGFVKGRRGMWVFWRGRLDEKGYIFSKQGEKTGDTWRKRDMEFEKLEKEMISDEEDNSKRRYGFDPFLQRSGRRGTFIAWDDSVNVDLMYEREEEEKWHEHNTVENHNQYEDWGKVKKKGEEFEKWH